MKPGHFDVVITTYEALKICNYALSKYQFNYAVFDEAHKIKNSEAEVAIIARRLKTQHRLLLTGTPLQNNIGELWSLLNFLMPKLFQSKDNFNEWFDFSKYDEQEQSEKKIEMV